VDLAGRVALVTGSGRRLGQAIALALGARGARVAVHYNASAGGATETVDRIRAAGGTAEPFVADLSDAEAAGALVHRVADAFGALDVLVNSAGIMERHPVPTVTPAAWDLAFAINVRAPFFTSQAAAARMGARGGVIVNIADLAAFEAWTGYVPHGVSKAALVALTRGLAHALAPHIRVAAVAPGAVLLPDGWAGAQSEHLVATTPLKRLGAPDDIVQTVLFLIASDYITGETIIVDGGRNVRR